MDFITWSFSLFMAGTVMSFAGLSLASRYSESSTVTKALRRFKATGHSGLFVWALYTLSLFSNVIAVILLTYPLLRLKPDDIAAATSVHISSSVQNATIFMYSILGAGSAIILLTHWCGKSNSGPVKSEGSGPS
jgi:quinol-cytochrome oxidoreductase complex cytochrome b subunit